MCAAVPSPIPSQSLSNQSCNISLVPFSSDIIEQSILESKQMLLLLLQNSHLHFGQQESRVEKEERCHQYKHPHRLLR